MPKSKFRPDPNTVQSGYYRDRMGTLDKSVRHGEDPIKSAAQENTSRPPSIDGGGGGGGAPTAGAIMKALNNGGQVEATPEASRSDLVLAQRSTANANPYVNQDIVQSGWFAPADVVKANPFIEDKGGVDFDHLEAERLTKGQGFDGEEEEEDDEEEEKSRKAAIRDVEKHYAPASEDSTHPEVHNAKDKTGLDNPSDAENWATGELYHKSGFGLDEMEAYIQKSQQNEVPVEAAAEILSTFLGEDLQKSDGEHPYWGEPASDEKTDDYANKDDSGHPFWGRPDKTEKEKKKVKKAGGEGSRGGKVIGRTKSGKPIYAKPNHPSHKEFSHEEHDEAAQAHVKTTKDRGAHGFHAAIAAQKRAEMGKKKDEAKKSMPSGAPGMGHGPEDGGPVEGAGKGSGASDAGMATAESTAQASRSKGKLYEGQKQSFKVTSADIEFDDGTVDLQAMAGGSRIGSLSKSGNPGQMLDFSNALERSHQMRSLAKAILDNQDVDIEVGVGVAPEFRIPDEVEDETEEYQKGLVFHSDRTDRAIQKSFDRHGDGSAVFATTSTPGVDLRSPVLHSRECGACGSLTKSYLTRCDVCGVAHGPAVQPGVSYSEDIQKALTPPDGSDIVFD
jgi:hypothetical protein